MRLFLRSRALSGSLRLRGNMKRGAAADNIDTVRKVPNSRGKAHLTAWKIKKGVNGNERNTI